MVYAPEEPEPDEPPTCDAFLECALECEGVTFGDTDDGEVACLGGCEAPSAMPADLLESWGRSCAELDGDPDLCDEGFDLCTHLENDDG